MERIGPYEIVRPLGKGGFAQTYEARHVVLDERACLKVGLDPKDDDLLLREGKILWGLHHSSLPTLRDVFRGPAGTLVLAMRFVEGTTLDRLTPMDLVTALRVFGRVLKALRVLHHRGIVHSDVKPKNIMVEPDRHGAVLIDFGLAALRPVASTRPLGFTEIFAPPEMLAGAPPIPESDLYGLALSIISSLGGDVERRVLPEAVPEELLRLLAALGARDPAKRPRWETCDILGWFGRVWRACTEGHPGLSSSSELDSWSWR